MARAMLHSVSLDDDRIPSWMRGAYQLFSESARADRYGIHTMTSDPEEADVIIFVELGGHGAFAERVRSHPYVKRFRDKCFLFDPCDDALPFLPGLYASLRMKHYDRSRTRTGYYLRIDENPYVGFRPPKKKYDYHASFVGSIQNHPIRKELAKLPHDRFLIEDTSSFALRLLMGDENKERHQFWSHYADSLAAAPFALCPRGRGPGSVRLFEAMQMGRVPVIISDEWVYPDRVEWRAFSITVPERNISHIPGILDQYHQHADAMGLRARQEWEIYYDKSARFHWIVEDCLILLRERRVPEFIAGTMVWRFLLNYRAIRRFLSSKKQLYRETGQILV